jgi:hypothetical protein
MAEINMAEVPDDEDLEIIVGPELLQYEPDTADDDAEDGTDREGIHDPRFGNYQYVEALKAKSDLKLLHEAAANAAYEHEGKLGLFYLFMNKLWFKAMLQWTNKSLSSKGQKKFLFSGSKL